MPTNSDMPSMATAAIQRFGDRLNAEQREVLIKTAQQLEDAAQDLRDWELANGDEPDSAFSAIDRQDS